MSQRRPRFDDSGVLAATVDVPAGITVLAVGAGWLLGRWSDEEGVERVGLWNLRD